MGKVPPALPTMRADLGLSLVESGFVQTVMYTMGATVGVFGGAITDRFGQKRFSIVGLGFMVFGGLLGAFAPGYGALLASRFLEGVGFILFTVSAAALITAATLPRDRASAFAFWACYMPTGGTLALAAAPLALATLGWRSLWAGLALYTLLCAVLVARSVPPAPFGGGVRSLRLLTESLSRPGILALCLVFICYVGQWTSVMTWLPTFAVDERGATPGAASWLTAAFVAANIPGNLLGGVLLKLGVKRWAVFASGALTMGLLSLVIFSSGAPDALRFACVLAYSVIGGVIPGVIFSATPVHAKSPQHIGTTNGMIMQSSHLSQFVVPIVVAWTATHLGGWSASRDAMLVLAGIGIAAAIAAGRFERRLERVAAGAAS
jgi:predicted MFS family arabinose efflux permease